jgi:hypothetical protein
VAPLAVIKAFDVLLNCRLRIGTRGVAMVMYQFVFCFVRGIRGWFRTTDLVF